MHEEEDKEVAHNPPHEEKLVWTFAYGANMSRASLAKRHVYPLQSVPAILPNHVLKFNLRGGMGNVQPQAGAEVHGIAHQLTQSDMYKLEFIEGRGKIYDVEMHRVRTYSGQEIEAKVFVGRPAILVDGDGRPCERYRDLILHTAREYGIDEKHIKHIESFEYVKRRSPAEYLKLKCPPRTPANTYDAARLRQLLAELAERRRLGGASEARTVITLLRDKIVRIRVRDDTMEMFLPFLNLVEGKDFALFYCSAINEPSLVKAHALEDLRDEHYAWVEDQMLGEAKDFWIEEAEVIGYLEPSTLD